MKTGTRLLANTQFGTISHANSNNNSDDDTQPPVFDFFPQAIFEHKIDEAITINFNEIVEAGTGNIIFSGDNDTRLIDVTDTRQVSFGWSKIGGEGGVFINPSDDFIVNTRYSMQIPGKAIQDPAGNTFTGINDPEAFIFTTIPSNPLLADFYADVLSNAPIKADQPIELIFDEPVMAGTGNIVISNGIDRHLININDTSQVSFDPDHRAAIIDPATDLIPNTQYILWTTYGAITDLTGHAFEGATLLQPFDIHPIASNPLLEWTNFWYGISMLPGESLSDLPFSEVLFNEIKADSNIVLRFDETVMAGTGNIIISNGTDTRTININDSNQVTFDTTGHVFINPIKDLLSNSVYNVHIPLGTIVDTKNNAYIGPDTSNALSFTTTSANPQLLDDTPWNEWVEFQIDENLHLIFDEVVIPGNGAITITNGVDIRTIDVHDTNQVIFDGKNVSINPLANLQPHTRYSILIPDGVIQDTLGKSFTGITDPAIRSFATIPTEPFLRLSEPLENIKNDEQIVLNFSEPVIPGSGAITITNGEDTHTIDIHDNDQVTFGPFNHMIIHPTRNLIVDTVYHILMPDGIVTDAQGNAFASINEPEKLSFTAITPGPLLQNTDPDFSFVDHNAFKSDSDLELYFDEAILPGNGTISISNGTDTRIIDIRDTNQVTFSQSKVTVNPVTDLIPNTQYNVQISNGAIIDTEGHAYTGINDPETFHLSTIAPNPQLSYSFLQNDSPDFMTNWDIALHFDENIITGNGTVTIHSDSDTRTIDIQDTRQITFGFQHITVNPQDDLLPNTHYSIQITSGAITDITGNPYDGIEDLTTLDFTTTDSEQVFGIF